MSRENETITNRIDFWNLGYLIVYGIVLARCVYETTMFSQDILVGTFRYALALMVLYVGAKLVFSHQYSRKEQIISVLLIALFAVVAYNTGYYELLEPALLIVGAKNIRFDNILKVFIGITAIIMLAAAIASQTGIIPDVIGYSLRNPDLPRHSFGIIYSTDFAAHIFYLVLTFATLEIWKRENFSWYVKGIPWIIVLLAAVFVYRKSGAFTSTICLAGFMILAASIWLMNKKGWGKAVCDKLKYLPVLWSALFLSLSYFYSADNHILSKINGWLSIRLSISNIAWNQYKVKLFGQFIPEFGWGGIVDSDGADAAQYFFLDDMYIKALFEYGIIVFAVILIILIVIAHRAVQAEHYILFAAVIMIGVHSFMEHHLLEMAYNPFLLILFANIRNNEKLPASGLKTQ